MLLFIVYLCEVILGELRQDHALQDIVGSMQQAHYQTFGLWVAKSRLHFTSVKD